MSMDVSLIIPTHNRPQKLAALLESIFLQVNALLERYSVEVIIVDDQSHERHKKFIRRFLANRPNSFVRYYELETNAGPGQTRNYGVSQSSGEIIIFLDDDYIADKDYLTHMISEHQRHPEIIFLNGCVMKMRNDLYSNYNANVYEAVFNTSDEDLCEVRMISSGNFSVKREALREFNPLFDKTLPTREDFDLYLRAQDAGIRVYRSKKPVTYNDCRSTFLGLIKQYWGYARGEYFLIKKYGKKRLNEEYRLHVAHRKKKFVLLDFILKQSYRLRMQLLSWQESIESAGKSRMKR